MRELDDAELAEVQGAGFGEVVEGAVTTVGGIGGIAAGMGAADAAIMATGLAAASLTLGGVILVAAGAGAVLYGIHQMSK